MVTASLANCVAFWHYKPDKNMDTSNIVCFDLDHTLIAPKGHSRFARSASDWKWLTDSTKAYVQSISEHATVVIFTNQGGVVPQRDKKSFLNLDGRINQVLKDLNVGNVRVYAACKNPSTLKYRKPNIGMWEKFVKDSKATPNKKKTVYVGDAAGRPGDHSDCDLGFALGAGIRFLTPEEFAANFGGLEEEFKCQKPRDVKAEADSEPKIETDDSSTPNKTDVVNAKSSPKVETRDQSEVEQAELKVELRDSDGAHSEVKKTKAIESASTEDSVKRRKIEE